MLDASPFRTPSRPWQLLIRQNMAWNETCARAGHQDCEVTEQRARLPQTRGLTASGSWPPRHSPSCTGSKEDRWSRKKAAMDAGLPSTRSPPASALIALPGSLHSPSATVLYPTVAAQWHGRPQPSWTLLAARWQPDGLRRAAHEEASCRGSACRWPEESSPACRQLCSLQASWAASASCGMPPAKWTQPVDASFHDTPVELGEHRL